MPSKIVLDGIGLRASPDLRLYSLFGSRLGGGMSGSTTLQNESDTSNDLIFSITFHIVMNYF
jgi:hypothetical protein